jgi:zinc transporter ZupT
MLALILFVSAVISGLAVFLVNKASKSKIKLLLSFSGSFLFAVCMVDLIPETYRNSTNDIGIYVLAGFFLQILLEYFSEGIEHGHIHVHKEQPHFPIAIVLSLCVHSFLEGMPLTSHGHDHTKLSTGIILHNIPIAFAFMTMLLQSNVSRVNAILLLMLFAVMAPAGMLVSTFISNNTLVDFSAYYNKVMAIVIGIFLHISTTILFESSEDHRFNTKKFVVIIIGAIVALISF